jgi:hypothetical protein
MTDEDGPSQAYGEGPRRAADIIHEMIAFAAEGLKEMEPITRSSLSRPSSRT